MASRQKNRGRRAGNPGRDMEVVEFHGLASTAVASSVLTIDLNPSGLGGLATGFGRLLALADTYSLFRWRSLRCRVLHSSISVAMGIVEDVADTAPANTAQVMELLHSLYHRTDVTVNSEWLRVPPSVLAGALPWYKSVAGAATDWEEVPCRLRLVTTGATDIPQIEIRGSIEFKSPIAVANTPALTAALRQAAADRIAVESGRERVRLLSVLSSGGSTTPPSSSAVHK